MRSPQTQKDNSDPPISDLAANCTIGTLMVVIIGIPISVGVLIWYGAPKLYDPIKAVIEFVF